MSYLLNLTKSVLDKSDSALLKNKRFVFCLILCKAHWVCMKCTNQVELNWNHQEQTLCALHVMGVLQVVLCGGSARIPRLQQMIREMFPDVELLSSSPPDEVIAVGAALEAGLLVGRDGLSPEEESVTVDVSAADILLKVCWSLKNTQYVRITFSRENMNHLFFVIVATWGMMRQDSQWNTFFHLCSVKGCFIVLLQRLFESWIPGCFLLICHRMNFNVNIYSLCCFT